MKIASVADVKARLSAYLEETQEGPVIVTRNGQAAVDSRERLACGSAGAGVL
jgi:hypothetical protein